jgi:hypothetical protein
MTDDLRAQFAECNQAVAPANETYRGMSADEQCGVTLPAG